MTTEDVGTSATARGAWGRHNKKFRLAAIGAAGLMALTACSSESGIIDGYFDNGDPIYIADKANLFDDDGNPKCSDATSFGTIENRARAFSDYGGTINSFLFEISNTEPDPNAPLDPEKFPDKESQDKERLRRERQQGSLDAMYQTTHPEFDARYGISSAEDLAGIKKEIKDHFPGLGTVLVSSQVQVDGSWTMIGDDRFSVRRVTDPSTFIELNGIDHEFNGLKYSYQDLSGGGKSYLLITDRGSGDIEILSSEGELEIDEALAIFSEYTIFEYDDDNVKVNYLHLSVLFDGCPAAASGTNYGRYWIYDYELLDPAATEEQN